MKNHFYGIESKRHANIKEGGIICAQYHFALCGSFISVVIGNSECYYELTIWCWKNIWAEFSMLQDKPVTNIELQFVMKNETIDRMHSSNSHTHLGN